MIDGILNINKPAGFTSHDVVAKLRGILHQKKIGHTGTLDPDATGVLPVCLGQATKLCQFLTDETKSYEAVLLLGTVTDTQDSTGNILSVYPVTCSEEELRTCAASFLGDQLQIPPMYSAIKKNGKKLYELARDGIEVEREPRPVTFYELTVSDVEMPRAHVRVTCSKGTYIRTLCHDIGQKLGCGACMEALVRTRAGRFCLEDSLTLEQISKAAEAGRLADCVMPVEEMFRHLPAAAAVPEGDALLHNGNTLPDEMVQLEKPDMPDTPDMPDMPAEEVRMYDSTGQFIGIFRSTDGRWKPRQMFWRRE